MTISPASLSQRIADGIVDLIRADGLAPGDAIASSRELARRFEVTTPTVREALRRLEATDVIRFRHGSGTYVGDGMRRRLMANPHVGTTDLASVLELVEARRTLEPPIAAAAALHRTDDHLAALERASENALRPQRADERPDEHFHIALAAATGNPLLRETVEALLQVRRVDQIAIRHGYDDRERDHREHVEILEALRDADPVAAADLTRSHLDSIHAALAARADEATS
ncbi:GntR family transcriptional regulator [Janibacter melonis]|uniref:GntR family transcriptional regulator n=1 Tax=Janibacter melonis TaxID=262209 RepID=A0A176QFG9_9MICO|nr:FCD domain-containing protein [Janibacter melonis]MBD5829499.1 FadR family transcriptional regulator [Janibacter melonis]OAB88454.1 GntR family transcriptional regulator [Janibacter melonis]